MSKNDLLYVKNMNLSESEEDDDIGDIWDDRKLNDAYDRALNIAHAEVAKRLAMSTNTPSIKDEINSKMAVPIPGLSKSHKKGKAKWKAGTHCRAVYEADGVEYEAVVMRVINDKECVVRFLGFENCEIVLINSLKASLGKGERNKQIADAFGDNLYDGVSNCSNTGDGPECSDRAQSQASVASVNRKKSKKKKAKTRNEFAFPELPTIPTPNLAYLKNLSAMDMPTPPPPLLGAAPAEQGSEQALSSMLLSWYMSGYYTGLYQGIKRAEQTRNQNTRNK